MGNQPTNYTHTCTNMQMHFLTSSVWYKQHTHQMNTDCKSVLHAHTHNVHASLYST